MYNTTTRPHPFVLAAYPRTPPQFRSPPTTPLPVYDPTPSQTSFLDLSPSSFRTSIRSRSSAETLQPYPPPNYIPEERYLDNRHPFAIATPIARVDDSHLFGCPTVYATRRLPELEDGGNGNTGYTPRRVSYLHEDPPISRSAVTAAGSDPTAACQPGASSRNVQEVMTTRPRLTPTPQSSASIAPACKVYTASSVNNLSSGTISGPKMSTVKWIRYDQDKRVNEFWVVTRYRHSYEINREVALGRGKDVLGSTRIRLEFSPAPSRPAARGRESGESVASPVSPPASTPLLTLDKALARLRIKHDELDSLVMDLEMVRMEMMVSHEAHERLRVKKRELKDRVKVLERDVEVYLRVAEVLSEGNELEV